MDSYKKYIKLKFQTATFKTTTEIKGVMSQMAFWGLCRHGVLSAGFFGITGFFVRRFFCPGFVYTTQL